MKKLLLFIAVITLAFTRVYAQPSAQPTTTLTKGTGSFFIDNDKYPLNSIVMKIRSNDTSQVELMYSYAGIVNNVVIPVKKRVKYINGTTGLPFASIGALKTFYDSFMVSPPFTTTIAGDLNILGDATAANQVLIIARLDSIAKYTSTQGVTVTHIDSLATFAVPAGSIVLNGVRDSNLASLSVANVSGLSTIEKGFFNLFPFYSVPMQSYRALATAHTITANVACNVFVLKLN